MSKALWLVGDESKILGSAEMSVDSLREWIITRHSGTVWVWVTSYDLGCMESVVTRQELYCGWRDRISMREIMIKGMACDQHVFWIRRFEENEA